MSLLAAMMMLVLGGCGDPEPECSETEACEFGEVCVEGTCFEIPCSTSAQCGMEEYCADRSCTPGCVEDTDCYPGDACDADTQTCEPKGCRDTRLDCGFNEFCNIDSGDCYEAGGYYCRECSGDEQCGGNGNMCLGFGGGHSYCGVTCSSDDDCPSGLGCYGIGDINGQIVSYQCYTYCWLYDDADQGFDKGARPAPEGLDFMYPVCAVEESP